MKAQEILDQILGILHTVKEDKDKLQKILEFLENPDLVPVPGLCVICRKHRMDDWEENLLCLMTTTTRWTAMILSAALMKKSKIVCLIS
jgi:hypothetical protein